MADALTGLTEVASNVEDVVSAQVQEVLTASLVVTPTIMDMSSMVGPGMDLLKIPRFGNFTPVAKVENVAVDAVVNAFATDDLPLDEYKVIQTLVEDIASLQSKVAVVQHYIEQSGRDLAADVDATVITAMEASPSAAAPDHIIVFDSAPDISKADFLAARELLTLQNVPLSERFCLLSPGQESSILAISEFVRVDESGGSAALRNGMIGRLFGFDVICSSQADDDATLFYHRSTHAFARQMAVKTEMDRDLANLADRWSLSHIFGEKALDSGKRIVKVNAAGA